MIQVIQNEYVKVSLDTVGAELKSIIGPEGVEYLWQGDPAYWKGQAPNLFPYIGRLVEGKYSYLDKTYDIGAHGFAKISEFVVEEQTEESIVFTIEETKETLAQYPFSFKFTVAYKLEGNRILIDYKVKNKSEEKLYFAVGGHPGFNAPLDDNAFEDYYLEFAEKSDAKRIEFSQKCLVTGNRFDYEMEDGVKIPLHHDMFDEDAIVLVDASREVTLKTDKGDKSVKVGYPDMKFIGFWHMPKKDAPYICIEPWSTLPSRDGDIEILDQQPDMVELEGKGNYNNSWWIEIN